MQYKFGVFVLDAREHLLLRDGEVVHLTPKAFETLLVLVDNHGHLVERRDLLDKIWPNINIEEKTLSQHIFTLRKILGASSTGQPYIQTISKRGYRFVHDVEVISKANTSSDGNGNAGTQAAIVEPLTEEALPERNSQADDNGNASGELTLVPDENIEPVRALAAQSVRRDPPSAEPRRWIARYNYLKGSWVLLVVVIISSIATLSLTIKKFGGWEQPQVHAIPFQKIKISNVTTIGKVWVTAVSPDGKYVAYVISDNGQFSLWVKQIDTVSQIELLGPTESRITGLTYSPDSKNIFYNLEDSTTKTFDLHQIPMLGGTPKKILQDIGSGVTFSPDGQRFAFIRTKPNETALIVANADGSQQRTLATRRSPLYYRFEGPAWSPDGKTIACAAGISGERTGVVEVNVENGSEREIVRPSWFLVEKVVWLSDGKTLIITAGDSKSTRQLWRVAYPGGEVSQITDGASSYLSPSLSADSRVLVAIQNDRFLEVFVASISSLSRPRRLTPLGGKFDSINGFSWTRDDRILYSSKVSGNSDIWIMRADGSEQRQLTMDAHANIFPTVSPDGKQVVFISDRSGSQQLWMMDTNGNNQVQLTKDEPAQRGAKSNLHWSPDGQAILYTLYGERPTVWKLKLNGNGPTQIITSYSYGGTISPDGKLMAYCAMDDKTNQVKLVIRKLDAGDQIIKEFEMAGEPSGGQLQWKADSSALLYVVNLDGKALLLGQPVSGGPAQQLFDLPSGLIEFFSLSTDGKELIYSNSFRAYDVTKLVESE
jgi:Tol biopolymer transport system component/DNA-binding winged helix-turn-helix (wHTH) protein